MAVDDALLARMWAWAAPAAEVDWDEVYA